MVTQPIYVKVKQWEVSDDNCCIKKTWKSLGLWKSSWNGVYKIFDTIEHRTLPCANCAISFTAMIRLSSCLFHFFSSPKTPCFSAASFNHICVPKRHAKNWRNKQCGFVDGSRDRSVVHARESHTKANPSKLLPSTNGEGCLCRWKQAGTVCLFCCGNEWYQ